MLFVCILSDTVQSKAQLSSSSSNSGSNDNSSGGVDGGGGYEDLDPTEAENARLRAQQPVQYASLQPDNVEDLYSRPIKRRK